MKRGLLSIDLIVAFSVILVMFIFLQNHTSSNLTNANRFGELSQLKASAIYVGSSMNDFYASSTKSGSSFILSPYEVKLLGGTNSIVSQKLLNEWLKQRYIAGGVVGGDVSRYSVVADISYDSVTGKVAYSSTWEDSQDFDSDGISTASERTMGTNPYEADTDIDGLTDGNEVTRTTDPLKPDTDNDGLKDGAEVSRGTDPKKADSDGDLLKDGDEVAYGINPLVKDSDGDDAYDGGEVSAGTDPKVYTEGITDLLVAFRSCTRTCSSGVIPNYGFSCVDKSGASLPSAVVSVYNASAAKGAPLMVYTYFSDGTISLVRIAMFNFELKCVTPGLEVSLVKLKSYIKVPQKIYPGSNIDLYTDSTKKFLVFVDGDNCAVFGLTPGGTCNNNPAPISSLYAGLEVYATPTTIDTTIDGFDWGVPIDGGIVLNPGEQLI